MPSLLKYIIWPLVLYAAYCGLLFLMQRQIMFPRNQIPQPSFSGRTNTARPEKILARYP